VHRINSPSDDPNDRCDQPINNNPQDYCVNLNPKMARQ
jgi:hypothetical protein